MLGNLNADGTATLMRLPYMPYAEHRRHLSPVGVVRLAAVLIVALLAAAVLPGLTAGSRATASGAVLATVERVAGQGSTSGSGLPIEPSFTTSVVPTVVGASLVYVNALPGASFVVRSKDGGSQTLVDITDAAAPTSYTFSIPLPTGARVVPQTDGGATVLTATGAVIGNLAAPWARDAAGRSVPSYYKFAGNVVTQIVDHRGATYPVVADPWVSWHWWGVTVGFTRSDLTFLAAVGSPAIGWLSKCCGGWGWAVAIAAQVALGFAWWASTYGYCLEINVTWFGGWSWPWFYRC